MFIYVLSIFLTSTAFVSTNAKIRLNSFEIYRILKNCHLGYDSKTNGFFKLSALTRIKNETELRPMKRASGSRKRSTRFASRQRSCRFIKAARLLLHIRKANASFKPLFSSQGQDLTRTQPHTRRSQARHSLFGSLRLSSPQRTQASSAVKQK